jgi:hypothetical protein
MSTPPAPLDLFHRALNRLSLSHRSIGALVRLPARRHRHCHPIGPKASAFRRRPRLLTPTAMSSAPSHHPQSPPPSSPPHLATVGPTIVQSRRFNRCRRIVTLPPSPRMHHPVTMVGLLGSTSLAYTMVGSKAPAAILLCLCVGDALKDGDGVNVEEEEEEEAGDNGGCGVARDETPSARSKSWRRGGLMLARNWGSAPIRRMVSAATRAAFTPTWIASGSSW